MRVATALQFNRWREVWPGEHYAFFQVGPLFGNLSCVRNKPWLDSPAWYANLGLSLWFFGRCMLIVCWGGGDRHIVLVYRNHFLWIYRKHQRKPLYG